MIAGSLFAGTDSGLRSAGSVVTLSELRALGLQIDATKHQRLASFVSLLLAENRRVNLTAANTPEELWRRHICDSLMLTRVIDPASAGALLDIGSGGGLPGLVVACACSGWRVTLLDATRKKVAALERLIAGLGMANVTVVWGRAEALAHDNAYRERFDVVTARAVAPLATLLEYGAGFTVPNGRAWFFKSEAALVTEMTIAARAARICGMERIEELRYLLPGESTPLVLVGYRKVGSLRAFLPRRAGRARKRPLS